MDPLDHRIGSGNQDLSPGQSHNSCVIPRTYAQVRTEGSRPVKGRQKFAQPAKLSKSG